MENSNDSKDNTKKTCYPKYLEPLHSSKVKDLKKEYHELTGDYYHGFQVFDNPQITVEQYIEDLRKTVEEERAKKNET